MRAHAVRDAGAGSGAVPPTRDTLTRGRRPSRTLLAALCCFIAVAAARPASAVPPLYAATWDYMNVGAPSHLYRISPPSTTATPVATLPISQLMGMSFTPDGRLFAYDSSSLYEVNSATGAVRRVGMPASDLSTLEGDLAYDNRTGLFYAAGAVYDSLITIDPATGARAQVGQPNSVSIGIDISGLAFAPDGTLFGLELRTALPDLLVTIDKSTGAITTVGPTGTNASRGVGGLAFDPADGTLYMAIDSDLYTVDLASGVSTLLGTLRPPGAPPNEVVGFVSALAILPEPGSTAIASVVGVLVLAALRRRGRQTTSIPAPTPRPETLYH